MTDMSTITIGGAEYRLVPKGAGHKIIRATRGYRDYIYVGTVTEDGEWFTVAPGGACIRRYVKHGLTGAAADPSLATLDRCETEVSIPASAVVDIIDCGPKWSDVL